MMASTADAKPAGKRSWQRAERQAFDEQSHKVWRAIVSVLAMFLVGAAIYYVWLFFQSPPKTLLLVISDDRTEYATVPPVPMLPGDEEALLGWARAAKVPTLLRKLPVVKDIGSFIDGLTSTDPTRPKFELLTVEPGQSGKDFPLKKNDTLIVYIRAHGMAAKSSSEGKPQPFLVTRFDRLQELSDRNAIPVANLLERLAAIPQVNKLVILDAVHFNYDPRLGQLINQFPTAVANAIPENAENLWVVLPTASGEQTAIVPQHERTIFNLAIVDALQAENHDGAKHVLLADLVTAMRSRYHQLLNTEVDLEYWQTLTQLPSLDDTQVAQKFKRAGTRIKFPTAPVPKKTADASASPPAAEKKSAAVHREFGPLDFTRPLTLAAAFQPPPDTAAPSATTPSATSPPAAGTPAAANPPGPMPTSPPPAPTPEPPPPSRPKTSASPPPAVEADADSGALTSLRSYQAKIAQAWQLRDELEQWDSAGQGGWSPIHFAPHQWRRLNAHLISHEERCRAGALGNSEKDLNGLIDYLQSLRTNVESSQTAGSWDQDVAYDLIGAWQRFRFGEGKVQSIAWRSFQASDSNALQPANRALKSYADCAYRLPEYVHLQGLMLSASSVQLNIDAEVDALIERLRQVRSEFSQLPAEGRIDRASAAQLENRVQALLNARRQVELKIKQKANELAQAQAIASPGRAQAICLMLQSPLLPATERTALLERVLPPLRPSALNTSQRLDSVSGGSGALVFDLLGDQVQREIKVIEFVSGQGVVRSGGQSSGALSISATNCAKNLRELIRPGANKSANALPLGAEFRQFLSQLPQQILAQQLSLKNKTEREVTREMFELYHWLLLVDGRDAGQLNQVPVFLMQPYLPEPVQDFVKLSLSPPTLQLTDKPQDLEVSIELITDKTDPQDLHARLSLQYDASTLEVVDIEDEKAAQIDRLIQMPGKIWKGKFRITSRIAGDQDSLPLRVEVKFGGGVAGRAATAAQVAEIRLPRPNLIDLKVVAEHRWKESDPLSGAEIERDQGSELRLFPNRETSLRVMLRNLSSADKKVRVQLVRPPERLVEQGRLYEEGGSLQATLRPLERQILSLKEGLPPQIAANVVASTNDKSPVVLPAAGSPPVAVNFELPAAAGAAPGAPNAAFDVSSGLICIISNVDNPGERFVKWLDLRPYAPDELFRVENFAEVGQDLSFQVRLLSADLAAGMNLDQNPLQVVWDRDGTSLGKPGRYDAELSPASLVASFRGPIPPGSRRNVVVRLHVDGYPRAFLYYLQLLDGRIIEQNLKQDRVVGVHISRLAFEKQLFHIQRPNWVFQPVTEPPPMPPDEEIIPQVLIRSNDHPFAGIRLDNRQQRQQLTYDLQADIASAAFSNGAFIEISAQEGQEPKRLYRDRDVRIKLIKTDKGVLTFETIVDDFRNLPLVVDTDAGSDTRVTLKAALSSSDFASPDGVHSLPIIFDRLAPEIRGAKLVANEINAIAGDSKGAAPVVVRLRATDNAGVGMSRIRARLVPRGGSAEAKPNDDNAVEIVNPPDAELQMELPVPPGLPPDRHEFVVQIEPIDRVGRVGKKTVLDLTINVQKVEEGKRGSLKPTFSKDANEKAKDLKELQKLKAQQQALQPGGGAGS